MLVLCREQGEAIDLYVGEGDNMTHISLLVCELRTNGTRKQVRIGVEATETVRIYRREVRDRLLLSGEKL